MKTEHTAGIESYAQHLAGSWVKNEGVQPITGLDPDITVDEAYQVQLHTIQKHVDDGQRITGKKIGLTSEAMQEVLGVDEPDYGHLLDKMEFENGGTIPSDYVLQPKVEGEIAFILKEDLTGLHVTSSDVLKATDSIVPALEIIDSRIKDWNITLADSIADNASSGLYVLGGNPQRITDLNLKEIEMKLYKNGVLQNTGVGAAALGDPVRCVAWLANKLAAYGITLKAGEVILSGALSAAVEAEPGDHFYASFDGLEEVHISFSENKENSNG